MIKLAENPDIFKNLCSSDTFGTRIYALFSAYSTKYNFADFWYQIVDDNITCAISKISGDITICASEDAYFEELAEFLDVVGYSSVTCEESIAKKLNLEYDSEGWIVEFTGDIVNYDDDFENSCDLAEIYDLIKSQGVGFLSDKQNWIADASFRINHGISRLALIKKDSGPASSAMVLFETDDAVFLGAVATYPEYRGQGLSRKIIHHLLSESNGKKAHLFCRKDTIVEFYKSIGFEIIGTFTVTYSKGNEK
ncbi:MAG: GNAT family N-acetyltransferase [Clostridia bacterium]|nr:GNAT family N-acetyltransferase [Clostridia bacterium]